MQSDPADLPEATPAIANEASETIQAVQGTDPLGTSADVAELTNSQSHVDASSPGAGAEQVSPLPDVDSWSGLATTPDQGEEASQDKKQPSVPPSSPDLVNQDWLETEIPYHPKPLGVVDQIFLLLTDMLRVWRRGLRWLRSQLPLEWQRTLSDELLTAILLGLVVLILVLGSPMGGGPRQTVITADQEAGNREPSGLIPGKASEPTPAIAPAPTPEANRIADIQAQVSRISQSYGAELIASVEVTLATNSLVVNLEEAWYGLLASEQDRIGQEIYDQAQQLGLIQLTLRTADGLVVGRSPVVGPAIVILQRLRPDPIRPSA
ncbi:MAG: hypothetical protein LVS60_01810 [Nodosilinea sp. LVE1205-7]|jgi:hypothetical protein